MDSVYLSTVSRVANQDSKPMSEDTPLSARAAHSAMARRPLFTFDSQHGSEERIVATQRRTSPQRDPSRHGDPLGADPGSKSDQGTPGGQTQAAAKTKVEAVATNWMDYPPSRWNNAQVAGFLESLRVPEKGLTMIVENDIQGAQLCAIIQAEDFQEILQEDLGIESRLTRRQIQGSLNQLMKDERDFQKGAGSIGYAPSEPKQMLLAGERAMKMPTIPKAQTGQDFCTAQEYKIFMQDAQDWANLQSKDYGQLPRSVESI